MNLRDTKIDEILQVYTYEGWDTVKAPFKRKKQLYLLMKSAKKYYYYNDRNTNKINKGIEPNFTKQDQFEDLTVKRFNAWYNTKHTRFYEIEGVVLLLLRQFRNEMKELLK